jgi:hypothetical protein
MTPVAPDHSRRLQMSAEGGRGKRRLNRAVDAKRIQEWRAANPPADHVRLNAHSAKGAGKVYELTPSKTLDIKFTPTEFVTNVASLLGANVMEGGGPWRKCRMQLDSKGIHPQSCMSGGDASLQHNAVRDTYEDYCRRGGLHPEHDAVGLPFNNVLITF